MFGADRTPIQLPHSTPRRVGAADVRHVEAATEALRAIDYQYGGGSCRDALIVLLPWGHRLLTADGTDAVRTRVRVAVADLHNLAGWTSFDIGLVGTARFHLGRALELAKEGGNQSLVANILYRMGRVYLHHQAAAEALTAFRLGQRAARVAGSPLAISLLCANEAWAHARLGAERDAIRQLAQAREAFAHADVTAAPPWARFFTETDLFAMIGTVHTELATTVHTRHTRPAIAALTEAVRRYGDDMARSRTFTLVLLAIDHLLAGDVDHAADVGTEAVELGETVRSVRTKDRIRPLKAVADRRSRDPRARELSERISTFLATAQEAA